MLTKFVRPYDAHLPGISLLHDFKQGAKFFNIIDSILADIHKHMSLFNANLGCGTVFLHPGNQYATLYPPQVIGLKNIMPLIAIQNGSVLFFIIFLHLLNSVVFQKPVRFRASNNPTIHHCYCNGSKVVIPLRFQDGTNPWPVC